MLQEAFCEANNYSDIVRDVAQTNVEYLGIAIAILLALGGFLYFINLKPILKKIKEQEKKLVKRGEEFNYRIDCIFKDIERVKKEGEQKINETEKRLAGFFDEQKKEIDIKIKNIEENEEKQLILMQQKANKLELKSIWNEHYMWEKGSYSVNSNSLRSLIEYLEKTIKYGELYAPISMCLESLLNILETIEEEKESIGEKDKLEFYKSLSDVLEKVNKKEHGKILSELARKAEDIFLKK